MVTSAMYSYIFKWTDRFFLSVFLLAHHLCSSISLVYNILLRCHVFLEPDTTRISHNIISFETTSSSKERDDNFVPSSTSPSKDEEILHSEG